MYRMRFVLLKAYFSEYLKTLYRQSLNTPQVGLIHGNKAQSNVMKTNTDPKAFPLSQYSARAVEARTLCAPLKPS